MLELLVQHAETRTLCHKHIKTEHLLHSGTILLHEKLADESIEVDLVMPSLVENDPASASLLAKLLVNSRSLGTENMSPVEAMQQNILVIRSKVLERQRAELDQAIASVAPDEKRSIENKVVEISMLLMKLKEITRHNGWEKALPILELD